jgi:hypothetical protein
MMSQAALSHHRAAARHNVRYAGYQHLSVDDFLHHAASKINL